MLEGIVIGELKVQAKHTTGKSRAAASGKVILARKNEDRHSHTWSSASPASPSSPTSAHFGHQRKRSLTKTGHITDDYANDGMTWGNRILQYIAIQPDVIDAMIRVYDAMRSTASGSIGGAATAADGESDQIASQVGAITARGDLVSFGEFRVLSYEHGKLIVYTVVPGGLVYAVVGDESTHSELAREYIMLRLG